MKNKLKYELKLQWENGDIQEEKGDCCDLILINSYMVDDKRKDVEIIIKNSMGKNYQTNDFFDKIITKLSLFTESNNKKLQ